MKIYFIIVLTIIFPVSVFGQQKLMSDAQFDGLKGNVKSVNYEWTSYNQNGDISYRRGESSFETHYDKDGNKAEVVDYEGKIPTHKTIYWRKNGETFYKRQVLSVSEQSTKTLPPPSPTQRIDSEKATAVDRSFDSRTKINYDAKGNLSEKLVYGNNGIFNNRRVYEYDVKGNKLKEVVFSGDGQIYNDSTKYIYDSKGMMIQQISFIANATKEEPKALPYRKLSYEYVKLDEKGNWIERKVFENIKRGVEVEPKLISVEYQTITYY